MIAYFFHDFTNLRKRIGGIRADDERLHTIHVFYSFGQLIDTQSVGTKFTTVAGRTLGRDGVFSFANMTQTKITSILILVVGDTDIAVIALGLITTALTQESFGVSGGVVDDEDTFALSEHLGDTILHELTVVSSRFRLHIHQENILGQTQGVRFGGVREVFVGHGLIF
ncbi:MAG: hypothetical protein H6766_02870 [Candidatus Peribacteria bacterium]|nr:MAG: hypothetical protein H6766_02870 [Candidatus Peribacteria bacterium]